MFWDFFSSAFGLVFGFLVAILAFCLLCFLMYCFGDWLEERQKRKQKKNCVRCIAKKKNPKAFSHVGTKLCDDCKKKDDKDEEDDEYGGNNIIQITNNGTTTTWINGRKVK